MSVLEPVWMLRLNPLRRTRIADPVLRALTGELHRLERETALLGTACCDALYACIGAAPEGERGPLVAARRAVHNDRLPPPLPRPLAPGPAHRLARWRDLREQRDAARAALERRHPHALAAERAALDTALTDPDLLRALALIAPVVHEAATRYAGGAGKRARKSERGLLQYLTRAMMRTSPLSRFTAVGLAVPSPSGASLDDVRFRGATPVLGFDRVMLRHVVDGLHPAEPEAAPSTWIRQPPTLTTAADGTAVTFLVEAGHGTAKRMSLPLSRPVRLLLDLTAMGPRTAGALATDLAGILDSAPGRTVDIVRAAVRAGFLCTATGPEDCDDDVLAAGLPVAGAVPDTEAPAPPAVPALAALRDRLTALAGLPHLERARELAVAAASIDSLSRAARRPALVTVTEDYLLPPVSLSTADRRADLEDLAQAVEFLSVFDRQHDVRALLTRTFVRQFGQGSSVRLTEHAEELVRAVERPEPTDGGPLPKLRALRSAIHDELNADLRAAPGDVPEHHWPAARLAELAAGMPEWFRQDPLSYGVLVQPADGLLIVNDAYGGHGMLYGRFLGPDTALGGSARDRLRHVLYARYGADGARVAEDRGLHQLNVNAHAPVLDEGLHADDWYRLRLVHDPDRDRLHVEDEDGRELRVLTLGTGHPERYPAPLRLANWLVGGGRLKTGLGPADGGATPRLRAGSVVLQRRRWDAREFVRCVDPASSDADRLAALTRWRARHDVPAEVFLKPLEHRAPGGSGSAGGRKPQYADLESALMTRVLPGFLRRGGTDLLVEEALPRAAASAHALEWVVEIARPAGGRFTYWNPPAPKKTKEEACEQD